MSQHRKHPGETPGPSEYTQSGGRSMMSAHRLAHAVRELLRSRRHGGHQARSAAPSSPAQPGSLAAELRRAAPSTSAASALPAR